MTNQGFASISALLAISVMILAGCATTRDATTVPADTPVPAPTIIRDLKTVEGPNGELVYDLTGFCANFASCFEVSREECGSGIRFWEPHQNPFGKYLFWCLRGPPKSAQADL
jgi:hypothetical protein